MHKVTIKQAGGKYGHFICPSCGNLNVHEDIVDIGFAIKTESECPNCKWSQSSLVFNHITA